jgi:carboxymethylenebutenolidase
MAIKGEWIRYGEGSGYFAKPDRAAGPLPGVLVIQEIGGVNEHMEDVTRRFAAAGYAALAPDLFAVNGDRPPALTRERISEAFGYAARQPLGTMFDPVTREAALAKLEETERTRIGETFGTVFSFASPGKYEVMMGPLQRAFRYLHDESAETRGQKTACVGFCMGGGMSALLACEQTELAGAAVFYGMAPAPEKIAKIRCPVVAFYGSKDQRVNPTIPAFQEGMRAAGRSFEHHVYDGASHAFFNDEGPVYDVAAARDSFARLLQFFTKVLTG